MGIAKVTLNGVAQIDLTGVTVVAEKLHDGYSAIGADGNPIAGNYTPPSATKTASAVASDPATASISFNVDGNPIDYILCTSSGFSDDQNSISGAQSPKYLIFAAHLDDTDYYYLGYSQLRLSNNEYSYQTIARGTTSASILTTSYSNGVFTLTTLGGGTSANNFGLFYPGATYNLRYRC